MATAAIAKPGQTLRRPRPSLNNIRNGSRAAATSTTTSTTTATVSTTDTVAKKPPEPYVRDSEYILAKFQGNPPSLIIHLHPTHFRFDQQDGSFSYDSPMKVFIEHLRHQSVPHEFMQELLADQVPFYDGCLIVRIHDHKSSVAKTPTPGNLPTKTVDGNIAFSMHNYHEHITPSPFAPYPRKPATQPSTSARSESVKHQDSGKDNAVTGPRVFTLVLHPTPLSRHHELMLLASTQSQRIEEKDYYPLEAEVLLTTEPRLLLDPAHTPEEAEKALDLLRHPLHGAAPPSPKARKRTHAEMAADQTQAAEEERRMLIMDERTKPSLRGTNGVSAAEGQTNSVALGFSKFKTLETIKKSHEENERKKKEEEAQKAMEKRQHDAQLAQKRKQLEDRHRQEQANLQQKQKMMLQQQQVLQQQQAAQQQAQQQQHAHNLAQPPTPINPQQQHLQQQAAMAAQHSSPIVRNPTPMMASSPVMPNAGGPMNMGGFPMQPTASNQGAGSPPRPPSAAMQHANIAMARQMSQQTQSRHATPQMTQGTPQLAAAIPMDANRQMSGTPLMQHRSPVPPHMQGTPGQAAMMAATPQMNHLTPTQQMAMMQQQQQRQRQMQQQQQAMHGSPNQVYTPEQIAMMRNQQSIALQQQQMNPQAYAQLQQQQRMHQMNNMQGGTPMMQTPSQQQQMGQQMGQQQQMAQGTPQAQAMQRAQIVQTSRAALMRTRAMMQQIATNGQPIPPELQQQYQRQQSVLQAATQQMNAAAAMRSTQTQQTLGDPSNTEQYMHNLRNQQALIARMQNQRSQQQAMNAAGMMNGNPQNMNMNMMQTPQMQQQMQQFAARQNAMNQQRPGSGMGQ